MNKIPMLEKFAAQSLVEHNGELIFSKEKFAELIVEECVGLCMNVNGDLPRTEPLVAASIRKYFGVKE